MPTPFLALATLATMLGSTGPQPTVPPLRIAACDYIAPPILGNQGMPPQEDSLRIAFVNTAPLVATHVRIVVRYGRETQTVDARGRFSEGALIVRHVAPDVEQTPSAPASCTLEAITYADGSRWPLG
jgi:hypothetical protein